jgi:hypothetical protein
MDTLQSYPLALAPYTPPPQRESYTGHKGSSHFRSNDHYGYDPQDQPRQEGYTGHKGPVHHSIAINAADYHGHSHRNEGYTGHKGSRAHGIVTITAADYYPGYTNVDPARKIPPQGFGVL